MREQLTSYDEPRSFGYTLSEVKGPMAPLVDHVEGLWSFEPVGTGTKVTWRWTIHPRSAFTAPVLPVFGRLWLGTRASRSRSCRTNWCGSYSDLAPTTRCRSGFICCSCWPQ